MGDIKSTLDIVMEKTRHLTLSRAEKEQQENDASGKKLAGLLQKYADQRIKTTQLKKEWGRLKSARGLSNDRLLLEAVFAHIDLDHDLQPWLDLLMEFGQADASQIEAVRAQYQTELDDEAQIMSQNIMSALSQNHEISGSAVVPNLDNNAAWRARCKDIKQKYGDHLNRIKANLPA